MVSSDQVTIHHIIIGECEHLIPFIPPALPQFYGSGTRNGFCFFIGTFCWGMPNVFFFFFFGNVDKMTVKGGVFQSSLENKVNTQGKIDMYESHE